MKIYIKYSKSKQKLHKFKNNISIKAECVDFATGIQNKLHYITTR